VRGHLTGVLILARGGAVIRLVLLLLGADFIRERWRALAVIGSLWGVLGLALFVDALDGVMYFPIHIFGYLLIIEALVTLVATTSNRGTQTVLRKSSSWGSSSSIRIVPVHSYSR
jgi:hypothetical protein